MQDDNSQTRPANNMPPVPKRKDSVLSLSVQQLLMAVLFIALGISAFRYGGPAADLAIGSVGVFVIVRAIVAFVGEGERKASASGFIVAMTAYLITTFVGLDKELDPKQGMLPTSHLIGSLFPTFANARHFNVVTGKEVSETQSNGPNVYTVFSPDATVFMLLGHIFTSFTIGCVGDRLARLEYRRRCKSHARARDRITP